MRKWAFFILLLSFLPIAMAPAYGSSQQTIWYYDGKITVTTKGTADSGETYDESTTITEFKLERWTAQPGVGHFQAHSMAAEVRLDDWNKTRDWHAAYKGKFRPENVGIILETNKTTGKYKLVVGSIFSVPKVRVTDVLGEHTQDMVLLHWVASLENMPMPENSPTPLEINGSVTRYPLNDGVPTKIAWVLSRHIAK